MPKKVLTADEIRDEVRQRILRVRDRPVSEDRANISIPLPKAHPVDAEKRNWDMEEIGHVGYDAYVRRVVEEARKEFLLSDVAEHDHVIGDSITHP
ncbi:hypothetical protein [Caballeronia grimmiae]|uniref:hypothetical protein n=1 Tax=Caballeronia grimmiae TaxID=1071679 RepID=UPI0038B79647